MANDTEVAALHVRLTATTAQLEQRVSRAEGRLNQFAQRGERSARRVDAAFQRTGRGSGLRMMRGGIANTAQQVQDLAVQFQAGTAASIIFAQQGPQILGAWGPLGAVLGGVAAVAIVAGNAFGIFGGEAEDASDDQKKLNEALEEYRRVAKLTAGDTAAIAEQYGVATIAVREFLEAQQSVLRDRTIRAAIAEFEQLTKAFQSQEIAGAEFGPGPETLENVNALNIGVKALTEELGLSDAAAKELQQTIVDASAAKSLDEQIRALEDIRKLLGEQKDAQGELPPEAQAFLDKLFDIEGKLREVVGATNDIAPALQNAIAAAGELEAAYDRAAAAAAGVAGAQIAGKRAAEIELKFLGDPVGKARALVEEEFRQIRLDTPGFDPTLNPELANELERQEGLATNAAVAEAKLRQEIVARRKAASGGSSRGGGGGASRGPKQRDLDLSGQSNRNAALEAELQISRRLATLRSQLNAAGMEEAQVSRAVASEQVRLNAEYERTAMVRDLEARAAKDGIAVTAEERQAIEALAAERERLTILIHEQAAAEEAAARAADEARQRQEEAAQAVADLSDRFTQAIQNAESFEDALKAVGLELANLVAQALAGQGPLASLFGGGGIGSLFGGGSSAISHIPAGPSAGFDPRFFHSGGIVGSGGTRANVSPAVFAGAPRMHSGGIAGLRPDEVPAILQRGEMVIPKGGVRGGGGGSVDARMSVVIDNPGASADEIMARLEPRLVRQQRETVGHVQRLWRHNPGAFPGSS